MTWPHLAAGLVLHPGFDVDRSLVDTCEGVVARVVSERAERENQGVFHFRLLKKVWCLKHRCKKGRSCTHPLNTVGAGLKITHPIFFFSIFKFFGCAK